MRQLVFATNNNHKLQEVREILGKDFEILSLKDISCDVDIPEDADTLEGNSLIKAQYIWEHFGIDCFADDTGLEVEALGGKPGVYSARYAGEPSNAQNNRLKLLSQMQGISNRRARFRTVVTLIEQGKVWQTEGIVNGQILTEEHGNGGFGYDSLFMPEGYEHSFAELGSQVKNTISHRALAISHLANYLRVIGR